MYGPLRIALRHRRASRSLFAASSTGLSSLGLWPVLAQDRPYSSKAKNNKRAKQDAENSTKASLYERDKSWGGRGTSTENLVPGSQQVLSGEAQAEYDHAKGKMKTTLDWFRREVATKELQGSGRVTPDILKSVRVSLPGMSEGDTCALLELATVGVREGTTLIVTAFTEDTFKHIEKAIYAARIPHVVPQGVDNRTIKIPLPKPTVDARVELAKSASKIAEEARAQLRRIEQASVKKGNFKKHSTASDELHELLQNNLKEVDKILADMKRSLGVM